MICLLMKMGGKGVRFGEETPKQFHRIKGKPLFAYVLEKYKKIKLIDKYIIVTNGDWMEITQDYARKILGDKLLEIVPGGNTNVESTFNGVKCAAKFLEDDDILLVHDVTNPIIVEKTIEDVINAAIENGCATVITEQVHALYTKSEKDEITGVVEKKTVGSGYSPEAFRFKIVFDCFSKADYDELSHMTSALSIVQAKGVNPKAIISHQLNLKITYWEDMKIFEKLLVDN